MESEFSEMSLVELVTRALLYGSQNDAILKEAEMRQESMNKELAAIVGKVAGDEWTPVGAISLDDGKYQIACCIRLKPVPAGSERVLGETYSLREGGGTFRDGR